jgi:hypothetical protein
MLLSRHHNAGKNRGLKIANNPFKNVTVQIHGNDCNKSKCDARRNEEDIEFL